MKLLFGQRNILMNILSYMENKTLMDSLDNLCKLSETIGKELHEQVKRQETCHITFDVFDMVVNNLK